jgi:MoxR-like ATPase
MADQVKFNYAPIFDDRRQPVIRPDFPSGEATADRAPAAMYVFDDSMRLRVNVSLATGRPLLVRGPSGVGKSSLAAAVAYRAGWNYIRRPVSSQTQAQDLLYELDQLKRLQDAYEDRLKGDERAYIRPGPLFWAFDAKGAHALLKETAREGLIPGNLRLDERWVLLIDEIDKADPDMPNNLLVPLGSLEFEVPEVSMKVSADPSRMPLLILTTNEERDLPPAFLRRCVELVIDEPDMPQLVAVATAHGLAQTETDLFTLATLYDAAPRPKEQRRNAAEFLDFVRAWQQLEIKGDQLTRDAILEAISGRVAR